MGDSLPHYTTMSIPSTHIQKWLPKLRRKQLIKIYIYIFIKKSDLKRGETDRASIHWFISPNACSAWSWECNPVSHVGDRNQARGGNLTQYSDVGHGVFIPGLDACSLTAVMLSNLWLIPFFILFK